MPLEKTLQQIILEAQMKSSGFQHSFSDVEWHFGKHKGHLWKIRRKYDKPDYTISMTGSAVVKQLFIPFSHKLLRVHLYHVDASDVESTDSLAVILNRSVGSVHEMLKFSDELWNKPYSVANVMRIFGEGYKFEPCYHSLSLNTTNGHKVAPIFYVEDLLK